MKRALSFIHRLSLKIRSSLWQIIIDLLFPYRKRYRQALARYEQDQEERRIRQSFAGIRNLTRFFTPQIPSAINKEGKSAQSQSFFFRLPLEIRRQIYKEVITCYLFTIEFMPAYRVLKTKRYKGHSPPICRAHQIYYKQPGKPDPWGVVDLLALPKTCYRVFEECAPLLYEGNWFHFRKDMDLLRFAMMVRPEMLYGVRAVRYQRKVFGPRRIGRRDNTLIDMEVDDLKILNTCERKDEREEEDCWCATCVRGLEGMGSDLEVQKKVLNVWEDKYLGPRRRRLDSDISIGDGIYFLS